MRGALTDRYVLKSGKCLFFCFFFEQNDCCVVRTGALFECRDVFGRAGLGSGSCNRHVRRAVPPLPGDTGHASIGIGSRTLGVRLLRERMETVKHPHRVRGTSARCVNPTLLLFIERRNARTYRADIHPSADTTRSCTPAYGRESVTT